LLKPKILRISGCTNLIQIRYQQAEMMDVQQNIEINVKSENLKILFSNYQISFIIENI